MKAAKLDAYVEVLLMTAVVDREPHVGAMIEDDTRYQDAMAAVHEAEPVYEEFRDSVELQRELGIRGFADGLRVRKKALELARQELAKARPAKGNGRRGRKGRMMTYEAFLDEYQRDSNARLIDRIVLKPNPGGPGGRSEGRRRGSTSTSPARPSPTGRRTRRGQRSRRSRRRRYGRPTCAGRGLRTGGAIDAG